MPSGGSWFVHRRRVALKRRRGSWTKNRARTVARSEPCLTASAPLRKATLTAAEISTELSQIKKNPITRVGLAVSVTSEGTFSWHLSKTQEALNRKATP